MTLPTSIQTQRQQNPPSCLVPTNLLHAASQVFPDKDWDMTDEQIQDELITLNQPPTTAGFTPRGRLATISDENDGDL